MPPASPKIVMQKVNPTGGLLKPRRSFLVAMSLAGNASPALWLFPALNTHPAAGRELMETVLETLQFDAETEEKSL